MADAPEVMNPSPHSPDNVVGDELDEVQTPFRQPSSHGPVELPSLYVDVPRHVPAGPDTDFRPPVPHVPDGVVGDQPDEIFTPHEPPPPHVPGGVDGDVLSEVDTPYVDVPSHSPDNVVGDVLPEVETPYADVAPHVPDGVVGDSLDEVPQPPPLDVPPPPAEPHDVPTLPVDPPVVVDEDSYGGPGEPPALPGGSHVPDRPAAPPEPERAPPPSPFTPPPGGLVLPRPHVPRGYAELFAEVADLDARLAAEVASSGDDPYSEGGGAYAAAGSRALDPSLYIRWMRDYLASVGVGGTIEFVAVQSALHALNEKYGRVFNVAYLAMRLPILNGSTSAALDVNARVHTEATDMGESLLPSVRRPETDVTGRMPDGTPITVREFNVHDVDRPLSEGSPLNFGGVVDAALLDELPADDPIASTEAAKFLVDVDMGAGGNNVSRKVVDMSRLFQPDGVRLRPGIARVRESQVLSRSSYGWRGSRGVIPAGFTADDDRFGYVMERIPDDVAYMPLVLIDLRPMQDGALRHVYFRALDLKTGEAMSPQWNEEQFFGRIDPAVGYQSTRREVRLSFSCRAFSPEDLPVIYRKRAWLSSMVYPEVSADSTFKSGPVVRLRVGDLYSTSRGGLAGVITSLDFDDSEQLWELKNGLRVPMGFAVSLNFLVLHEGTPGILEGRFTVSRQAQRRESPGDTVETVALEDDPNLFAHIMPRRR